MPGLIVYAGIFLFISGIIESVFAISYRKIHPGWTWQNGILTGIFWNVVLIAGLFSFLIGILIFYHSVIAALTIVGIISIIFMIHRFFLTFFSLEAASQ